MKQILIIFTIIFLGCTKYIIPQTTVSEKKLVSPDFLLQEDIVTGQDDFLFIGGKIFDNYRKSHIPTIKLVSLYIYPGRKDLRNSLEGIEQLVNMTALILHGTNLDDLDYSPLKSLPNLKLISFDCKELSKIPDLSGINLLTHITFTDCALTSLDNIELIPSLRYFRVERNDRTDLTGVKALNQLPNLEELYIRTDTFYVDDIASLTKLRVLDLWYCGTVDIKGIGKLSALKDLSLEGSNVKNIECLSELINLEALRFTAKGTEPEIQFLKTMKGLTWLAIRADSSILTHEGEEPYQMLDIGSLGDLADLKELYINGYIVKNIAVLDTLEHLDTIDMVYSVLHNEAEKTKKQIIFEYDGR
jgi:Leucine-rich repeat (LRR) protein